MTPAVTERPGDTATETGSGASRDPSASSGPLELGLFLHALRLAWVARRIHGETPLVRVVEDLNALPLLPRQVEIPAAVRAAKRASIRMRRWLGGLDTCLVRAMVAGALLSDRDGVAMHLGLLPPGGEADDAAGHAWLTVAGEIVEVTGEDGSRYPEIHRIEMRRGGST